MDIYFLSSEELSDHRRGEAVRPIACMGLGILDEASSFIGFYNKT